MKLRNSYGYYVPVPRPLPLPTFYARSSPDRMLRFNYQWTPYVLAMLAGLARPETYDGETRSEYAFAVSEGQEILNGIEDIPVPLTPLEFSITTGSLHGQIGWIDNNNYSSADGWQDLLVGDLDSSVNIGITVKLASDHTPAGGYLSVAVHYVPVASKVYAITGNSCTGLIADSGFAEDGFKFWSWEDAKDVSISLDAVYAAVFTVTVDGPPVCGEA